MSASQETPYTADWLRGALRQSEMDSRNDPPLPPGGHHRLHAGTGLGDPIPRTVADLGLKDHEVAQVVNELRRIALEYGGSQQLRERIATYIKPILRGEGRP